MTNKLLILLLVSFLFLGCAAASTKTNSLSLGMTRTEVVDVMGIPSSTSETEGVLYLKYRLQNGMTANDYYVRLIDGKVDAYGRFGEFSLGY